MKNTINTLELEDAINDAVNLIHQLGNELVAILNGNGDAVIPGDESIAAARAVGISRQQDEVASRLHQAFHSPARRTASPLAEN